MITERLPQLDGLRAVAVTMVMAFHFVPGTSGAAPLGSIGVRLFFVLSGFLITRILLPSTRIQFAGAESNARSGQARLAVIRNFYIRRGLRIFPLFYLVLALAALVNIGPVRETIGWHVTYLTNFYLFERGAWHGSISHLWSLAVEEQFYLVWPWLIFLWPERRLPVLIVAMVCLAPLSRLIVVGPMTSVLPLSCVDALGAGALLALSSTRRPVMSAGLLIGVPLTLVMLTLRYAGVSGPPFEVALDFGVSLTGAWVVGRAIPGFRGSIGRFLAARPVVYIGTISYGLYLYHGFMPYLLGRYVPDFLQLSWPIRCLMLSAATLLMASLSWRFFEAPILKLKDVTISDLRSRIADQSTIRRPTIDPKSAI